MIAISRDIFYFSRQYVTVAKEKIVATKFAILAHNKVSTLERYNFLVRRVIDLKFGYDINQDAEQFVSKFQVG